MREKLPSILNEVGSRDSPIITLLSDFGDRDPYVGSMKGVILSICRRARIVDITHNVAKFNVLEGGFILAAVAPYFPSGTIHIAVVDPGVGSKRKALLVKTKRSYLIGPDNGILMLAANQDGIEKVFEINNPRYMLAKVSSTFHGRDIFCAVAAHLANGVPTNEIGPEIDEYVKTKFSKPSTIEGKVSGEVVHIDDFGNIITNISLRELNELKIIPGSTINVGIGSVTKKMKFSRTYGDAAIGEHLALIGSTGFLELSIVKGNAASVDKAAGGTHVTISRSQLRKEEK